MEGVWGLFVSRMREFERESGGVVVEVCLDLGVGRSALRRWPSLWIFQCSSEGFWGGVCSGYGFRSGSGTFLPKRDSKEFLDRYVRSADIRAAVNPERGGYSQWEKKERGDTSLGE